MYFIVTEISNLAKIIYGFADIIWKEMILKSRMITNSHIFLATYTVRYMTGLPCNGRDNYSVRYKNSLMCIGK